MLDSDENPGNNTFKQHIDNAESRGLLVDKHNKANSDPYTASTQETGGMV